MIDDANVRILGGKKFVLAERVDVGAAVRELVGKYTFGERVAAEMVFVNGRFETELSRLGGLPKGVRVMSWEEAIAKEEEGDDNLRDYAKDIEQSFPGVNFDGKQEGALIQVDKGVVCERPIHVMFLTVGKSRQTDAVAASFPLVFVAADEGAECSVVETYASDGREEKYLTHAFTTIVLSESANVDHYKLQQEGAEASHMAVQHVHMHAKSSFVNHSMSIGSEFAQNKLEVFFFEEGAEATLNGLVIAKDEQSIENRTLLYHGVGNCSSLELYKHVLDGKAKVGFEGKIFVKEGANGTDSKLASKSLVLTDEACMEAKPELEIYADDVKCSHGATSGPVDENAVFYLVSRGLSLEQARHLMTYAFAADVTRRIRVAAVRERVEGLLAERYGLPREGIEE